MFAEAARQKEFHATSDPERARLTKDHRSVEPVEEVLLGLLWRALPCWRTPCSLTRWWAWAVRRLSSADVAAFD
ncbi:MAG: hypothetical protein M3066_01770 [Actinomycetota bacterium]|nr:hypothetical protein [Actinomycetota bacterium]